MSTRILRESQGRAALIKCLYRIRHPLNRYLLKIKWFRETEICMRVGEFHLFFRPFTFSDLIMLFTDYEPYVKRIFHPREGETVVDVGAHIGVYTLKAARDVGDQGTVVSFEPDQRNFRLLKKNIRINRFRRVKLFNAALDKSSGRKTLYMGYDPLYSSLRTSERSIDLPSANKKERNRVKTLALDTVVESLKLTHIDWIKIDVEGSELDVLEGGKKAFNNLVERVIIETSDANAIRFLTVRDFRIQRLFGFYYLASKIRTG